MPPSNEVGSLDRQNGAVPNSSDSPVQVGNTLADLEQKIKDLEAKVALRTQQLMASTSRAYEFLDSLNMGFIMFDVNGQVVISNQSIRKILQIKAGHDQQISTWDSATIQKLFLPELDISKNVQQILHEPKMLEYKDISCGPNVLHLFFAPLTGQSAEGESQQLGVVTLIENVTEQKVLERSKDEFLSIASHELRTPLTAIRGNSAMIKKYYGDQIPVKDVNEMIEDIHESSVRLIDIVNDFLDASKLEQGSMNMEPVDFTISDVVGEVMRDLKTICEEKGVQLVQDPSLASLPHAKADKMRIKQVIYNLIGNSSKFTEKGSITVSGQADDHFIYISVTDTGRGMPPEAQKLLFRKFQQAGSSLLERDTTKGTGLGLYISKQIVELSGGKIGLAHSEPGIGSTFTFSLPRA